MLQKVINTPQNIRFSEFKNLMEHYGFQFISSRGSHFVYKHPVFQKMLPIQKEDGMAKPYQVNQFLRILEENNVI